MSTGELAARPVLPATTRMIARATIGCGLVLLAFNFVRFLITAIREVRFPYQLDYGEGIVWQQMRLMFQGKGYAPADSFPAIVFHYPPLYHSTVHAIASTTGMDELVSGRLVSLSGTIVCALLVGSIVARLMRSEGRIASATCAGFAALAGFTLAPLTIWATVMRVDMMAIALSLAGLWFGLGSLERPRQIYVAALCFVAAVFTKQTAIAAAVAVFATLLLVRPATALRGIALCLAVGSSVLLPLALATHGGIIRHLFLYNVNRFDPVGLLLLIAVVANHALFFAAVAAGIALSLRGRLDGYIAQPSWAARRARLAERRGDAALLMVLLYFAATTMTAMLVAKSGANINYLVEWMLAGTIFAGLAMRDSIAAARNRESQAPSPFWVLLPLALGAQALATGTIASERFAAREERRPQLDQLSAMVRTSPSPVISDDMVILLRSGKEVVIEPAIFAELTSTGVWDERPFIDRIRAGGFSFFITEGDRGGREFDSRYRPAVIAAMAAAYPVKCLLAGYTIHLPRSARGLPVGCAVVARRL